MTTKTRDECSKKVAIAVDFSEHAEYAVQWYIDVFHRPNNQVVLLHVPELIEANMMSPTIVAELIHDLEIKIGEMKQKYLRLLKDLKIEGEFLRISGGKPGEAIVDYLKSNDIFIIVTGTRGQGVIRRTVLGSVSEYILHHSPVPVLICSKKNAPPAINN